MASTKRRRSPVKTIPWKTTGLLVGTKVEDGIDRFEIDPSIIPDGMVYQWCSISILGQEDTFKLKEWKRGGWRPVPAKRHPGCKSSGRNIVVGGQMLMERSIELNAKAIAEEKRKADEAISPVKEHLCREGDTKNIINGTPAQISADDWRPDRPIADTAVEVTIKVWMTAGEVEVASRCKMTNERYVKNKLTLMRQGRMPQEIAAALVPNDDGMLQFAGMKVSLARAMAK